MQPVVGDDLQALGQAGGPEHVQPGGHDHPAGAAQRQGRRHLAGQQRGSGPAHGRAVVGEPVGEQVQQLGLVPVTGLAVPGLAPGRGRVGCATARTGRGEAVGPADAGQDVVARGHAGPPLLGRCSWRHHWRKLIAGGTGASRAPVQADSGGGSRRMRPPRPSARPARAARWAAW